MYVCVCVEEETHTRHGAVTCSCFTLQTHNTHNNRVLLIISTLSANNSRWSLGRALEQNKFINVPFPQGLNISAFKSIIKELYYLTVGSFGSWCLVEIKYFRRLYYN